MAQELLKRLEDDFYLLLEAGFMAVNSMDEDSAIKLFKAAEILKPDNTFPHIGFGYMHMCKLELKQAAVIFEEISKKDPDNEMAKAFLGICMSMTPTEMSKGESILTQTAAKSKDPEMKKLADTALDFVDNFVKKAPSPVEPKTPKKNDANKKKK